jgi:hypothetical protein
MDIKSFYSFLDVAGISPLCEKLLQTDRYPALRLILAFEKAMCDNEVPSIYVKEGKFDEFTFSNDMVGAFPLQIQKLKVNSEKEEKFWNIFHLIIRKFYHFMSIAEGITDEQKLNFFREQFAAIKISTFLSAEVGEANFIALNTFLRDVIAELENKIALITNLKNDKAGSTIPELKNSKSIEKKEETRKGTRKSPTINTGPKYLPFEKLFTDEQMIEPLINYLKRDKIRILDDNGHWLGLTSKKTEIMGFINALHKRTSINFTTSLEVGLAFKEKFHISISTRSFTIPTHTRNDMVNSYLRIIDAFLAEYNSHKSQKSS